MRELVASRGTAPALCGGASFVAIVAVALVSGGLLACRRPELPDYGKVPEFALRDQHELPVSPADLRGKIWIANFMFASCPDICPILTSKLAGVRLHLHADRVMAQYVSFSVDPEHDTPAVLAKYVSEHAVDFSDWRFVTGPLAKVEQVIIGGFKQALQREPPEPGKPQNIMHGSHFVLVDPALTIRGFYPSDEEGLLRLARDARILSLEKKP